MAAIAPLPAASSDLIVVSPPSSQHAAGSLDDVDRPPPTDRESKLLAQLKAMEAHYRGFKEHCLNAEALVKIVHQQEILDLRTAHAASMAVVLSDEKAAWIKVGASRERASMLEKMVEDLQSNIQKLLQWSGNWCKGGGKGKGGDSKSKALEGKAKAPDGKGTNLLFLPAGNRTAGTGNSA
jgi:hypothetical protein